MISISVIFMLPYFQLTIGITYKIWEQQMAHGYDYPHKVYQVLYLNLLISKFLNLEPVKHTRAK